MEELDPGIVRRLRAMATKGDAPSAMLRYLAANSGQLLPHKVTLVRYMRAAFGLSLQQASPIAGWSPDGSGELSDARLDELVKPEITRNRPEWEQMAAEASAA
jgi:hypothetical protein